VETYTMGWIARGSRKCSFLQLACALSILGSAAQAFAQPALLTEFASCLPKHCALKFSLSPRPDPSLSHFRLLLGSQRLDRSLLTSLLHVLPIRAIALEPPELLKSKIQSVALQAGGARKQPEPTFDPGVRGSLRLPHGRELSVALTPTPKHCAPLVEMRF